MSKMNMKKEDAIRELIKLEREETKRRSPGRYYLETRFALKKLIEHINYALQFESRDDLLKKKAELLT